jgi:hypothetical protein
MEGEGKLDRQQMAVYPRALEVGRWLKRTAGSFHYVVLDQTDYSS